MKKCDEYYIKNKKENTRFSVQKYGNGLRPFIRESVVMRQGVN